jgi:DnaJ family protein C protein 27
MAGGGTHYELLGINASANADEIRKAYKKAALRYHPDKGGDEEVFKAVCMAMETLSDDMKRAYYDRNLGLATRPTAANPTAASTAAPTPPSSKPGGSWWEGVYTKTTEHMKKEKNPASSFVFTPVRSSFSKAELASACRLKILSIGLDGCGKSALIKRFCEGRFVDKYITTVLADYGVKAVQLSNKRIAKINLFDLSGLATFAAGRKEFYAETQGLLVVFDVGNLASFRAVPDLVNEARTGGVAMILVGNKIDGNRAVTVEEARRISDTLGAKYFETSAATGEGVNEAMMALFNAAYTVADYGKGA